MNTQHNPARRMVFILLLVVLFFTAVSMACSVQDAVDATCNPAVSVTQCTHTLP
jgi:hypothetical protein